MELKKNNNKVKEFHLESTKRKQKLCVFESKSYL